LRGHCRSMEGRPRKRILAQVETLSQHSWAVLGVRTLRRKRVASSGRGEAMWSDLRRLSLVRGTEKEKFAETLQGGLAKRHVSFEHLAGVKKTGHPKGAWKGVRYVELSLEKKK